jgi:hypothetical protein
MANGSRVNRRPLSSNGPSGRAATATRISMVASLPTL